MNADAAPVCDVAPAMRALPRWITSARGRTVDAVAFSSGAALARLDTVLRDPAAVVPLALLRDRRALEASVACLRFHGRSDAMPEIRDAISLARPGDALGPAGDMALAWRRATQVATGVPGWRQRMMSILPEPVAAAAPSVSAPDGSPVAHAAAVLSDLLQRFPREEAAALMLADLALARAVGWDHVLPLLGAHLTPADLRSLGAGDEDALPRVHIALTAACDAAIRSASDLARRAARLAQVAPKLRAKTAPDAVRLFLARDAVSPSVSLTDFMTDRAARRLCDRLVTLGAVRELTGRDTFRLYGL